MLAETRAAVDRLVWNVRIFDALLIDQWKQKDAVADWSEMIRGLEVENQPDKYLHQIVMLLMKRGMLRFKPPRSLAD